MNTLDLVKERKVMLAIASKAEEAGFVVLEATNDQVYIWKEQRNINECYCS